MAIGDRHGLRARVEQRSSVTKLPFTDAERCGRVRTVNVVIIIFPPAIAYSMGQVINSVCLCQSVCPSVCLSVRTLTVAFLDRFSSKVATTPKSKNTFIGVNTAPSLPLFCSQKSYFEPKVPENPCKHKYAISALKVRK